MKLFQKKPIPKCPHIGVLGKLCHNCWGKGYIDKKFFGIKDGVCRHCLGPGWFPNDGKERLNDHTCPDAK
jgi:hypothetical protein